MHPPKNCGSSQNHLLLALLEEARSHYVFSGYQLWMSHQGNVQSFAGGVGSYWDGGPVTATTWFDLASLTKVIGTTTMLLRLVQERALTISSRLDTLLPELRGAEIGSLTPADCLSHRAGFVAWYPIYLERPQNLLEWFIHRSATIYDPARRQQGTQLYSDLGFILLGEVVRRVTGESLGAAFRRLVQGPMNLATIGFQVPQGTVSVSTEWRGESVLTGEVFDENCAYLNGEAGHAGLFGTADAVGKWATEWLRAVSGQAGVLDPALARQWTERVNPAQGTRTLGWDTKSGSGSSAGTLFSDSTFGHLGFTGVSVWIDPRTESIAVFLTNRVHPSRLDDRIRAFRPKLHDAIARSWKENQHQR